MHAFQTFLNQILLNKFLAEDQNTGDALGLPHFNFGSVLWLCVSVSWVACMFLFWSA